LSVTLPTTVPMENSVILLTTHVLLTVSLLLIVPLQTQASVVSCAQRIEHVFPLLQPRAPLELIVL